MGEHFKSIVSRFLARWIRRSATWLSIGVDKFSPRIAWANFRWPVDRCTLRVNRPSRPMPPAPLLDERHAPLKSPRRFASTVSRHRRGAGSAVLAGLPTVLTAKKTDSPLVVGDGEHRYEVQHDWPQLPDKFTWQTTHNVAVDKSGCLYVIHEGKADQKDHPSIFVFDPDGQCIRSFGQQFQGGGHGIEIREDAGQEFLYVCAYQALKTFAKLDLNGETVWQKYAPMESGLYAAEEDTKPSGKWGRDRFMPTNFAFLDDGGFLLADGYGAFYIHRYDKDGKWLSMLRRAWRRKREVQHPARPMGRPPRRARAGDRRLRSGQQHAAIFFAGRQISRDPHRLRPAGECRDVEEPARDSQLHADHATGRQEPGRGAAGR